MKKLLILIAFLCSNADAAYAAFFSGNELLARMNSSDTHFRGSAIGYIAGVADANFTHSHCLPDNITLGAVRNAIKMHLENVPDKVHLPANYHIEYVLKTTWPCGIRPESK